MNDTEPQIAAEKVLWHFTMSLDGFVAGPNHEMDWMTGISFRPGLVDEYVETTGAVLAGRAGWDAGHHPYGGAWDGPIFVLTHHPEHGTPADGVTFLDCDPAEAVRIGLEAAGGKNLEVFSPTIGRQLLERGLIDEIDLHVAPILLGKGIRLYDNPSGQPICLQRVGEGDAGSMMSETPMVEVDKATDIVTIEDSAQNDYARLAVNVRYRPTTTAKITDGETQSTHESRTTSPTPATNAGSTNAAQSVTNSAWPAGISAITLFVEDLDTTKQFYREVFGLTVVFEDDDSAVFDFGNTVINLLRTTAAAELIEPARVANPDAGSHTQLTVTVDDVDAMCEELTARGVTLLNGPVDRPWGIRTAGFRDPGGHIWEIAQ